MSASGSGVERRMPAAPGQATVLVVDDSRAIRRILRRGLEESGYRVVEAGNGLEGLAACREELPDLVLLDIDMPVMDGLTTMQHLKADPDLRTLPVLFLTARTGGQDVAAGLDLGAQDYLRKPCEPAELTARVASALRLKAQEKALLEQTQLLGDLSTTDPLTGLGNRRRLQQAVGELIAAEGLQTPVGVLLGDLDHFKRVNDTLGHPVGDTVLRIAAGRMGAAIPPEAVLVRWGGEEFLAVCPHLGGSVLEAVGEAVRASVAGSPFSVGTEVDLQVTISLGGAQGAVADLDAVVARADTALYRAKQEGRNRVCLDQPPA